MRKILLSVAMFTVLLSAEVNVKSQLAAATLVTVSGAVLFPAIVVGDIQYGILKSRDRCDRGRIYVVAPYIDNGTRFGLKFVLTCKEWEHLGTGRNIKEK